MILNALEGKPLPVYGDGGTVRDWLFVGEHCAAISAVLGRGRVGETYNIGSSRGAVIGSLHGGSLLLIKEDPSSIRSDSRRSTCNGIPDTFLRIRTTKVVATWLLLYYAVSREIT